ncbi:MAG: DsbA family protein [Pikeienuella sp.]|uniref:DsbA family protein n=1 Tax=Pikeienuella sp. TaxID=2831957 RepID=UPI00391BCA3C
MMKRLAAPIFALCALLAAPASAEGLDDAARAEINAMIRDYILDNPEVIVEAMQVLEQRQKAAEAGRDADMIAANADAIYEDGFSHVGGAPDGDVTVVEFIDYRCPYCKRAHASVAELMEADPKVRRIIKEFPILGPESTYASRAAIAAMMQGGAIYEAFGDAMMTHQGELNERAVLRLAGEAGADVERLKADMEKPEIAENIRKTYALARQLGISGTPGFIIGERIVRGFVPADALRDLVAEARRAG